MATRQINLIVTRHRGLLDWLLARYPDLAGVPVIGHATAEDVAGKHVLGVLPLSLARYAASVAEVSLPLLRPEQRGKELTIAEMDAAGATLCEPLYVLTADELHQGGYAV